MTRFLRMSITGAAAYNGPATVARMVDSFARRVEADFGAPAVIVVLSPAPEGEEGWRPNDLVAIEAFAAFTPDNDWRKVLRGAARRITRRLT